MTDEEDDYMSDKLIATMQQTDIKPGLYKSKNLQRKIFVEKQKQRFRTKSKREVEWERQRLEKKNRDQGLGTALNENNKGFQLLTKLGYRPGEAIGNNKREPIQEPITVAIKSDRKGLGSSEAKTVETSSRTSFPKTSQTEFKVNSEGMTEDFKKRKATMFSSKIVLNDLYKSQKICLHLDCDLLLREPKITWFWPKVERQQEDNDEMEDEEEDWCPRERLTIITNYLRKNYFYCLWCGIKYNDETDMTSNCPGDSREEHDDDEN